MKILAILLPFFCAAAAGPSVDALIEAARTAPPEFLSDALIRIASNSQLEKPRKIELLNQAFERAAGAQLPYKRTSGLLRPDGQAAYWNRVYGQDLDALSLRLRAVSAMLPLDGVKARELFVQIPPLKLPRATCDDFLVYDASRFYEVLGVVARQSFSDKEAQDGELARFLQRYAGAISSAVEIAPMAV